jgi:RecA/RadA recombinase
MRGPGAVAVSQLRVQQKCGLGCPVLNAFLSGGIPCGTVTELVGECGSGKTLLSLQLLLSVQAPVMRGGLQGRALCIYTEGRFPSRRLFELATFACGHADGLTTTCKGQANVEGESGTGKVPVEKRIWTGEHERGNVLGDRVLSRRENDQIGRRPEGLPVDRAAGKENCFFGADGGNNRRVKRDCDRYSEENDGYFCGKRRLGGDSQRLPAQAAGRGSQPDGVAAKERLHCCLNARRLCEKVLVKEVQTIDELLHLLSNEILQLLRHRFLTPVKLIVIDSVAALFRADFDNNKTDLSKRASLFFRLSAKLKQYAQQFNIAIVVTNQVTDCFDEVQSDQEYMEHLITSGRFVRPALGLSWSHCVNTRLFLSRIPQQDCSMLHKFQGHVRHGSEVIEHCNSGGGGEGLDGRRIQVVFAPHLPQDSCAFTVTKRGMQGVQLFGAGGMSFCR